MDDTAFMCIFINAFYLSSGHIECHCTNKHSYDTIIPLNVERKWTLCT